MPLIIKQGKQDTSNDVKVYEPVEQRNAMVQIVEIKLADNIPDTLILNMQVLDGANKNRYVTDRITFDPQSPLSWKYRNVRRAVGVPYVETEPTSIDVEGIFLNKAMRVDLGKKEGVDRMGNPKIYQTINYKPMQSTAPIPQATEEVKPNKPAPTLMPKETFPKEEDIDW